MLRTRVTALVLTCTCIAMAEGTTRTQPPARQTVPLAEARAIESLEQLLEHSGTVVEWAPLQQELTRNDINVQFRLREGNIIPITMTRETHTEGRGFLNLKWDKREAVNMELIEIGNNLHIIRSVTGGTSLKAPLGMWHVTSEQVPSFYTGPGVGAMIHGELRKEAVTIGSENPQW